MILSIFKFDSVKRPLLFGIILISFLLFSCKEKKADQNAKVNEEATQLNLKQIDLVVVNGKIIDGTGKKAYQGNIYINNDSIVYIGELSDPAIKISKTIDAQGKFVTPGFIDLHAHGDPLSTPEFENFLAMGVTSIVLGQDGESANVKDIETYIHQVNQQNLGVNIIEFVGHGTLRDVIGIGVKAKLSTAELESLKALLASQLKYTFGMSTGLEYAPGLYAEESELLELAKVVGSQNKMIMSHLRNEDDHEILEAITELSKQGKYARVHVSHLKAVYGKGAERAHEILDSIQKLKDSGIRITADMYPYLASYTGIAILFPDWSKTSEQFEIVKKTRRKELENFIRNKVNLRNGPEATLLGTAPYVGMTLAEAAASKNKSFENFLIDDIGPNGASAAYFVMNKELQETFFKDTNMGICSDGSKTGYHPRGHGTFAKIIETYVVKDSLLSFEKVIKKMTSHAAEILQLKNRGILKVGYKADIIVFHPENVKANASFVSPHEYAEGFDVVIVNGKVAREHNQIAAKRVGKVLLPD